MWGHLCLGSCFGALVLWALLCRLFYFLGGAIVAVALLCQGRYCVRGAIVSVALLCWGAIVLGSVLCLGRYCSLSLVIVYSCCALGISDYPYIFSIVFSF